MCGLFSIFSFSFWLIDFQQEYLGTDIYVNFYVAGVVSCLAGQVNLALHPVMGMRELVHLSVSLMITSGLFIVLVQ